MTTSERPHFDHVGLNVRDLDSMSRWYADAFGYREQVRYDLDGLDLRIVMLVDDAGRRFELLARSSGAPGLRASTPVEAAGTWGFGHVAFVVPDLAAAYERLAVDQAGVLAPAPSPQAGRWFAWVRDPEGNLVELIGPQPA